MSGNQYQRYGSKMLPSTLKVCEKALEMNRTPSENKALGKRLQYELKHALWSGNFQVAEGLVQLGEKTGLKTPIFSIYKLWAKVKLDLSTGLNATHERLNKKNSYAALRISARMNYTLNFKSETYAHVEINNDLSDIKDNFNGLIIVGLKSNLFESISIYSEIRNDYDSSPSNINIDKNEFLITMGLAYDF